MSSTAVPEIRFVCPGTEEWVYLWGRLRREYGNTTQRDPHSGERWQYMGTANFTRVDLKKKGHEGDEPGWWHEFRHRMHPSNRYYRSLYWRSRASDSYQAFENYRAKQERVNHYV